MADMVKKDPTIPTPKQSPIEKIKRRIFLGINFILAQTLFLQGIATKTTFLKFFWGILLTICLPVKEPTKAIISKTGIYQ
jgi:hypothetical protein